MPELASETHPSDLVSVTEAAHLLPSRKQGCRLDVGTLYRWVERGYLRAWAFRPPGAKKGSLFVSRAEVFALFQPVVPAVRRREGSGGRGQESEVEDATRRERLRRADRALDAAGI